MDKTNAANAQIGFVSANHLNKSGSVRRLFK